MDLSVILPIYDERENLAPLLDEIETALGGTGKGFEIIAVDDGSTDGSRELLRRLQAERPQLRVILFRRNFGQAAAFDAGFRHARGDVLVTMDADRQNDPADIPTLVAKLDDGFDVVTGWRRRRRDGFVLRRLPSRAGNWLIRRVTGTRVHDLGCSLKAYRRAITDDMRLYGEMHRFIPVLAEQLGARIAEVEVNHRARGAGRSKYGLGRTGKVLLDLLTAWFMRRYQTKPIYVFGALAFALFAIALGLAGFVLWEKIELGVWVHRNPLFILAAISGLLGGQFLGTGIVAELLMRTYFESQRKPAYTVEARLGFPAEPPPVRG
jgi:glycosyltransferase involved in cell wall biosynthesis